MRMPLIVGNWKMNTTVAEAVGLVSQMYRELDQIENIEKVVCPPYVSLVVVGELIKVKGSSLKLGAQNLFYEEKGAYTGEISPLMLAELCHFVIIGHSERRHHFNETDKIVNKKLRAALKVGLKPILCIGESLAENEAGQTKDVVTEQLSSALAGVDSLNGMVIAYEPVWAIGTGRAASGHQANSTIGHIRHTVEKLYHGEAAGNIRLLYGGSVTAENIAEFVSRPEIDGALVGGASLQAAQFISIVRQTAEIKGG